MTLETAAGVMRREIPYSEILGQMTEEEEEEEEAVAAAEAVESTLSTRMLEAVKFPWIICSTTCNCDKPRAVPAAILTLVLQFRAFSGPLAAMAITKNPHPPQKPHQPPQSSCSRNISKLELSASETNMFSAAGGRENNFASSYYRSLFCLQELIQKHYNDAIEEEEEGHEL
jgi:hypothetical protein